MLVVFASGWALTLGVTPNFAQRGESSIIHLSQPRWRTTTWLARKRDIEGCLIYVVVSSVDQMLGVEVAFGRLVNLNRLRPCIKDDTLTVEALPEEEEEMKSSEAMTVRMPCCHAVARRRVAACIRRRHAR